MDVHDTYMITSHAKGNNRLTGWWKVGSILRHNVNLSYGNRRVILQSK